jgi:putative membrane protein
MDTISTLQKQFPLSPKKLLKKVIEKMLALYVLAAVGVIIDLILIFTTKDAKDPAVGAILWGALILGLALVVVITLLYTWYVKVYIKRYYYDGEENFITIKKGVFAPTEIHVQWQKIQDVYVDQDILDRIMGLYDVHIASATVSSGIEAHIDGVDKDAAEGLKKFFLDKMTNKSASYKDATSPEIQPTKDTPAINLSEEISSKIYPLTQKWTVIAIISRIANSIIFPGIFVFAFLGEFKAKSLAEGAGYFFLAWLVLTIVMSIISIISLFLWKKNYAFSFGPDNIYSKEGVISLSEKHMPYSSVQDVTVQQGVLDRIVGLAKVRIENAGSKSVITGRGAQVVFTGVLLQGLSLADANKITNLLKTNVLGKNSNKYGL